MSILVLFDIDGTLISTRGKAFAALTEAFQRVVGVEPPVEGYSPAGKTDPQIVAELLSRFTHNHRQETRTVASILRAYRMLLPKVLQPHHVRVLPGAARLLEVLSQHPEVFLGVLTGNIREGARLKLQLADLGRYFPVGAFGSDSPNRCQLLPFAWERAREHFRQSFSPENTVIVGDTPADVAGAKTWQAKAIAVAGQTHDAVSLLKARPDAVVGNLNPEWFLPVLFAVASNRH